MEEIKLMKISFWWIIRERTFTIIKVYKICIAVEKRRREPPGMSPAIPNYSSPHLPSLSAIPKVQHVLAYHQQEPTQCLTAPPTCPVHLWMNKLHVRQVHPTRRSKIDLPNSSELLKPAATFNTALVSTSLMSPHVWALIICLKFLQLNQVTKIKCTNISYIHVKKDAKISKSMA